MKAEHLQAVLHSAAFDKNLLDVEDFDKAISFVTHDPLPSPAQREHMLRGLRGMREAIVRFDNLTRACRHLRRVLLNLPVDQADAMWACQFLEDITAEVGVIPGDNGVLMAQAVATVRMKYPRSPT